jgi:hypothetical protein
LDLALTADSQISERVRCHGGAMVGVRRALVKEKWREFSRNVGAPVDPLCFQ